eukprot:6100442-Prymnesium_polylepis.1
MAPSSPMAHASSCSAHRQPALGRSAWQSERTPRSPMVLPLMTSAALRRARASHRTRCAANRQQLGRRQREMSRVRRLGHGPHGRISHAWQAQQRVGVRAQQAFGVRWQQVFGGRWQQAFGVRVSASVWRSGVSMRLAFGCQHAFGRWLPS